MSGTSTGQTSGLLPEALFDSQVFVDAFRVKWVYRKASNYWYPEGKVDAIPVADGTNIGLLSSRLKFLVDSIPEKGGGFAIITNPLLAKRTGRNPDGVLFGDIELISDSLDIQCVDSNGSILGDNCTKVAFKEYDTLPPGFDINLSTALLDTLCVEVPGGPGLKGQKGDKGEPGVDGTGDGPIGRKGDSGKDATVRSKFSGVQIIDVDDIYDTAVVKLDLDGTAGKLFVTKAKLALPNDDTTPADQLVVAQISRGVVLGECWDYNLIRLPCRFNDDFDVVDPLIAYYPGTFDPANVDGQRSFGLVRARLSDLVNSMISFYKGKLDDAATKYDADIADFIKTKDDEARKVLDQLGDRLTECENITYLEYCIGIEGECNEPPPPPVSAGGPGAGQVSASDPDCSALIDLFSCTDKASSSCQNLGTVNIKSVHSPVLSFASPPPGGAISQNPPSGLHPNSEISATFAPFEAAFRTALANAVVAYPRQQIPYSSLSREFPPGRYVFIWQSGAFRQDKRNNSERENIDESLLVNGLFQDYWVGGDSGNLPLCLATPSLQSACGAITGPLVSMDFGLEIGYVATAGFGGGVPPTFFTQHPFDANSEVGAPSYELPLSRVDFVGLPQSVIDQEKAISWQKFHPAGGSFTDQGDLENFLNSQPLLQRIVVIETAMSCYFFARVKTAFGVISPVSTFVLPPVTLQGSLGNGQPIRNVSFNRVTFSTQTLQRPFLNARPIATGEVTFKVVKVDCKDTVPTVTGTAGSGGTGVNPNNPPPSVDNAGDEISPNPNEAQPGAAVQ